MTVWDLKQHKKEDGQMYYDKDKFKTFPQVLEKWILEYLVNNGKLKSRYDSKKLDLGFGIFLSPK